MSSPERRWIQSASKARSRPTTEQLLWLKPPERVSRPLLRLVTAGLVFMGSCVGLVVFREPLESLVVTAHRAVIQASDDFMAQLDAWSQAPHEYETAPPPRNPELFPTPTIPAASPPPTGWITLEGGSLCPADEYHLIEGNQACDFVIPPPGNELHEYYLRMYAQQRGIPLPPPFGPPPTEVPPTPDPFAGPPGATVAYDNLGRPVWVDPNRTDAYGQLLILGQAGPNPYPEYPYGETLGGGVFPSESGEGETNAASTLDMCPAGMARLVYLVEAPVGSGTGAGECVPIGAFCETVNSQAPGAIDGSGRCDGSADTGTLRELSHDLQSLWEQSTR